MVSDTLNSFKENIARRITNPFLGTFLIVWIIDNWRFVFSLFNFDGNMTLSTKLNIISCEFRDYKIYHLGFTFLKSIGLLLFTYIGLSVSRAVSNIFDKNFIPWIYKKTVSNSTVLRTEYDEIADRYEKIQKDLIQEKEEKSQYRNTIEQLEKRIGELANKEIADKSDSTQLSSKTQDKIFKVAQTINLEDKTDVFIDSVINLRNNEDLSLLDQETIKFFIQHDLIEYDSDDYHGNPLYRITDFGNKVYDYINFK